MRCSTSCQRRSFNSEAAKMETAPQIARLANSYDSFSMALRSWLLTSCERKTKARNHFVDPVH